MWEEEEEEEEEEKEWLTEGSRNVTRTIQQNSNLRGSGGTREGRWGGPKKIA